MSGRFHVKRKGSIRTFVRSLIGAAILGAFAVLVFGALRGTVAFWGFGGSCLLVVLWWGLR